MRNMHNPPHPGEVLQEWLTEVSANISLRLSRALGTTPGTWYGMHTDYGMWQARQHFRGKVRAITSSNRDAAGLRQPLRADSWAAA
jgi:plasmid maintenance system antidote protein VapI